MKKLISLCLAVFVSLGVILPLNASAAGIEWIELLENATLNSSGTNDFSYTSTKTIEFPTTHYMHVTKVDMLLYHTAGTAPSKVEVYDKYNWHTLNIENISSSITRVYGDIGNSMLSSIQVRFTKSGTTSSYVELKSFKIYTLPFTYTAVEYDFGLSVSTGDYDVLLDRQVSVPAVLSEPIYNRNYLFYGYIMNASAFDFFNMSFAVSKGSVESIAVRYGDRYVPFQYSFIDSETHSVWENSVDTGEADFVNEFGEYFCTLHIDLTGIDRQPDSIIQVIVTGGYSTVTGMRMVMSELSGGLVVADETEVRNWIRFKNFISEQFTNLGTWISTQTSTLKTELTNLKTTLNNALTIVNNSISTGFTNVKTWINSQTTALVNKLTDFRDSVSQSFTTLFGILASYFEVQDQDAIDDLGQSSDSISQGASDINNFEQSQQDTFNTGFAAIQSAVTFTNFAAALVFVQRYANMTINGISDYTIVFTLPLFLGLFFYLCSRIPGVTRWKSRPPKSKGGGSP